MGAVYGDLDVDMIPRGQSGVRQEAGILARSISIFACIIIFENEAFFYPMAGHGSQ